MEDCNRAHCCFLFEGLFGFVVLIQSHPLSFTDLLGLLANTFATPAGHFVQPHENSSLCLEVLQK